MEFSRQEHWSGLPFSSPGDLSDPGIDPTSSALQAASLPSELPGKSELTPSLYNFYFITLCNLQSTVLFIYYIHWVLSPSSPIKYKNLHKKVTLSAVLTVIPSTQNHASLMANRLFKNSNRSMNYDLTKTDWSYQDHIFSIAICSMEFVRAQWMFMKSGKLAGPKVTLLRSESDKGLSSVQLLSHVRLFATPWITARQASLSITNSQSLLKLMPIESVMPSSHLILCCPLLLLPPIPPSIRVFSSESFASGDQSIGVSASASILPMNKQDWSSLGWTGWISLQSKGLSRVFSNTTVQKHQFFGTQLSSQSNPQIHTWPLEKP